MWGYYKFVVNETLHGWWGEGIGEWVKKYFKANNLKLGPVKSSKKNILLVWRLNIVKQQLFVES